jgi:hypothetical protein
MSASGLEAPIRVQRQRFDREPAQPEKCGHCGKLLNEHYWNAEATFSYGSGKFMDMDVCSRQCAIEVLQAAPDGLKFFCIMRQPEEGD